MRHLTLFPILFVVLLAGNAAMAQPQTFKLDPAHSSVRFKISHIGFSWLYGRFQNVSGQFKYDPENPANSSARFTVKTASINTHHEKRDKHLRSGDFFAVDKYPKATFVSTSYEKTGADSAVLKGKLTIKDVTRPVNFQVTEMGARKDPWGSFRRAFNAKTKIDLSAFNITDSLGSVEHATLVVAIEGTRQSS